MVVMTPPPSLPSCEEAQAESELLNLVISGDEGAFEMMIRRYSRRLFAIAYGIVQNQTEAEDLVQETFVKAYRERVKFREADKFPAWLQMVTRNAARDVLRRRRPQVSEEEFQALPDEAQRPPGSRLDEAQVQAHLKTALSRLPEEHRLALTLRYLEGLDHRGIEATMGLSNGALRGLLGRGLAALRRHLEPLDLGRAREMNRP